MIKFNAEGKPMGFPSVKNFKPDAQVAFVGFPGERQVPEYPAWRYHKILDPVVVKDSIEDREYLEKGYEAPGAIATANKQLINWYWDLEDMSARQLVVFAQDEYGIDLPVEAGQEKLFQVVCKLSKDAPQNKGRIVLMAQTIQMNYDETLNEIRREIDSGEAETKTFEVWL